MGRRGREVGGEGRRWMGAKYSTCCAVSCIWYLFRLLRLQQQQHRVLTSLSSVNQHQAGLSVALPASSASGSMVPALRQVPNGLQADVHLHFTIRRRRVTRALRNAAKNAQVVLNQSCSPKGWYYFFTIYMAPAIDVHVDYVRV